MEKLQITGIESFSKKAHNINFDKQLGNNLYESGFGL